jgi:endoribonuclease Dicer
MIAGKGATGGNESCLAPTTAPKSHMADESPDTLPCSGTSAQLDRHGNAHDDSDDDSNKYLLKVEPENTRKVSERRRADNAKFQSWLERHQAEVVKTVQKSQTGEPAYMSFARMIKQNETKKIIASPREYQIELFERAKQKNIIAVLDTGAGKTLIAALLLRHILEQEVEGRAAGKPKKVAFFLVSLY